MQYGAMIPNLGAAVDPIEIAALTRQVEAEAGYDTLMVSDHVVMPTSLTSRYPYNSSGIPTFNAEHDILEPFTLLSFLAGITQRVRLGISVQVLPYRHPVLNTKMITTLDVLSQGRIIVGAGVGWMEEEIPSHRRRLPQPWLRHRRTHPALQAAMHRGRAGVPRQALPLGGLQDEAQASAEAPSSHLGRGHHRAWQASRRAHGPRLACSGREPRGHPETPG